MDFKELEYVLVIAREKYISRAAEKLYISQPALSRFLMNLEERMDTKLFERTSKQYMLTPAGELYVQMAESVLSIKHEFDMNLAELRKGDVRKLRIGITPGRGRTVLPILLPEFSRRYPNYQLELYEDNVQKLESMMENGEIEIAFFTLDRYSHLSGSRIRCELLSREEIVLCCEKGSSLAADAVDREGFSFPWVDLGKFRYQSFLLLKNNMRLGSMAVRILEEEKIVQSVRITQIGSIDTALALVGQGYGVCFASSFRIKGHEAYPHIQVLSFGKERVCWDFIAAFRKDYQLQEAARFLVDSMKEL